MSTQLFARPAVQRQWHSEPTRQDAIEREAKVIAGHIKTALPFNARNQDAVGDAMLDQLGQEEMAMIVHCLMCGNDGLLGLVVLLGAVMDKAIFEVAEYHAIKVIEERGPVVFDY